MTRKTRLFLDNVLPFQAFLQRVKVISLLRQFIRRANLIRSPELKLDIRKQIRDNFRGNCHVSDPIVIRHLFQDANKQLKMLEGLGQEKHLSPVQPICDVVHKDKTVVGEGWPWNRNQS